MFQNSQNLLFQETSVNFVLFCLIDSLTNTRSLMFCFNVKYWFINQINCFPPNLASTLFESCKRRALHQSIICGNEEIHAFLISVTPSKNGTFSKSFRVSVFRHLEKVPSSFYKGEYGYLFLDSDLEIDWDIVIAMIHIS